MAPKSTKSNGNHNAATTPAETPPVVAKTFTKAEKIELIANYQIACDELRIQETLLEEEKQKKLEVFEGVKQGAIAELREAFGDKNFSISGVLMRVVHKTDKVTKEKSWAVRTIDVSADEVF